MTVSHAILVTGYNETGKGDHRHRAGRETSYVFTSVDALVKDFLKDVTRWRNENHG